MRIRPPSLGCLYLILAAVGFVAYFAYLRAPMFWDLKDEHARDLAEARYLISIADSGKPLQRTEWLSDAMKLASKHAEWQLASSILASSIANKIKLSSDALTELVPGKCWVAGTTSLQGAQQQATQNQVAAGKATIALLSHNHRAPEWTLLTNWSSSRDGAIQTREQGKSWQAHAITTGANATVEWVIPAGKTTWLEVRADAAMFTENDQPGGPFQGVRLKDAKAKS